MKTCNRCGAAKPIGEFHRDRSRSDGHREQCKPCLLAVARGRYTHKLLQEFGAAPIVCKRCEKAFDSPNVRGRLRSYCSLECQRQAAEHRAAESVDRACPCGSADVALAGVPKCPTCIAQDAPARIKETNRRRQLARYGLTTEQYASLFAKQHGVCAICGTDNPRGRGWHIDHDHSCCPVGGSCGTCVRGVLCTNCNAILGWSKDSPERLARAQEYLLKNTNVLIFPAKAV